MHLRCIRLDLASQGIVAVRLTRLRAPPLARAQARVLPGSRDHDLRLHHPSVVLWSLANEPGIDTSGGEAFLRKLASETRAIDSTRPITYVTHREPESRVAPTP